MLEFIGTYTPWAALIGLILGAIWTYKAGKKSLLWPTLGFGIIVVVATVAGFGVLPWIGNDLGAIVKLIAGLVFGFWIPVALVYFFKEFMAAGKKVIKM